VVCRREGKGGRARGWGRGDEKAEQSRWEDGENGVDGWRRRRREAGGKAWSGGGGGAERRRGRRGRTAAEAQRGGREDVDEWRRRCREAGGKTWTSGGGGAERRRGRRGRVDNCGPVGIVGGQAGWREGDSGAGTKKGKLAAVGWDDSGGLAVCLYVVGRMFTPLLGGASARRLRAPSSGASEQRVC